MKILKTEFDKRGFRYKQIWRDENYAIYSQDKHRTHFEAIRVRIVPNYTMGGVEIEGGETYPGDNKWGTDGFTLFTEQEAFAKIEEMRQRDIKNANSKLQSKKKA